MYPPIVAIILTIIPFTLATDCTVSDSSPWPFGGSSGGSSSSGSSSGGGSVTDVCAQFKNDAAQFQACTEEAAKGSCNAVGGSACSDSSDSSGDSDDSTSSDDSDGSGLIKKLRARNTLTCTSSELCYQYTNHTLVCFDIATSDYHDDIGGMGNYLEGTYKTPDGKVTGEPSTASGSAHSTATDTSSSTATHAGNNSQSTSSSTAKAPSNAAATTTSASATPASGGEIMRAHALVGALGLGAALVL